LFKEERCDTLMEDDVEIDSRFAVDGSIVEYRDRLMDSLRQREFPMDSLR
jgi:hypothetical protein